MPFFFEAGLMGRVMVGKVAGPPMQSTGPLQTDAGVGIGMKIIENLIILNGKGH